MGQVGRIRKGGIDVFDRELRIVVDKIVFGQAFGEAVDEVLS